MNDTAFCLPETYSLMGETVSYTNNNLKHQCWKGSTEKSGEKTREREEPQEREQASCRRGEEGLDSWDFIHSFGKYLLIKHTTF